MKAKYYFVVIKKYGEIFDVFTFNKKAEVTEWKKRELKMYGDDVQFIYTSYVPETWDTFELKSKDWGI